MKSTRSEGRLERDGLLVFGEFEEGEDAVDVEFGCFIEERESFGVSVVSKSAEFLSLNVELFG